MRTVELTTLVPWSQVPGLEDVSGIGRYTTEVDLGSDWTDRDAVREKRWQAGYDLALGRVLALKVRTDAYNIMLAEAKSGMTFEDPRNDTWRLVAYDDISAVGSPPRFASQPDDHRRTARPGSRGCPQARAARCRRRER